MEKLGPATFTCIQRERRDSATSLALAISMVALTPSTSMQEHAARQVEQEQHPHHAQKSQADGPRLSNIAVMYGGMVPRVDIDSNKLV